MKIKRKLKLFLIITFSLIISTLLISLLLLIYFYSKPLETSNISMSEEGAACIQGQFPFPNLYDIELSEEFEAEFDNQTVFLDKYPLFAQSFCITPTSLLEEDTEYKTELSILSLSFTSENINTYSGFYPNIINKIDAIKEVNVSETLTLQLDKADSVFNYYITTNNLISKCTRVDDVLDCPLTELGLKQGEKYKLSISSTHKKQYIETISSIEIQIRNSVTLLQSNIDNKDTLTKHNPLFELEFSNKIDSYDEITLKQYVNNEYIDIDFETYNIQASSDNSKLMVNIEKALPKSSSFLLTVNKIVSIDNSFLEEPIEILFYTSDGPTVYSSSPSTLGFSTHHNITVSWDEVLDSRQDIKSLISFSPATTFSSSISGSTVTINPTSNLKGCTTYTLSISKGARSNYGVISDKSYSKTFKTSCATVSSIGTSVNGSRLYSYRFGNGANKIIFYGAMHGSESNTQTLLYEWINELDNKYSSIPPDRTVIVIPTINPDGVAAGTRFNANEVDLNRNFDTSDWQAKTYFANTEYPNGGGSSPFSEPESKAISNYILSQNPYLTVSYHSAAAYVIPNQIASAASYGQSYSNKSGYSYISPSVNNAFEYNITGSFGRWSSEIGKPALVIELASRYSSEASRNLPAMWEMLK